MPTVGSYLVIGYAACCVFMFDLCMCRCRGPSLRMILDSLRFIMAKYEVVAMNSCVEGVWFSGNAKLKRGK